MALVEQGDLSETSPCHLAGMRAADRLEAAVFGVSTLLSMREVFEQITCSQHKWGRIG